MTQNKNNNTQSPENLSAEMENDTMKKPMKRSTIDFKEVKRKENVTLDGFNRTMRFANVVLPINSIIECNVQVLSIRNRINLRVMDYLGESNNILTYVVSSYDNNEDIELQSESLTYLYLRLTPNATGTEFNREYFIGTSPEFSSGFKVTINSIYQPSDAVKVLILGGPSGAGKTFLERFLVKEYPEIFSKTTQVTTREKRDESDPYLFASQEIFDSISNMLVGRILGENKYANSYGTLPNFYSDKINTIILSEEGYHDFIKYCNKNPHIIAMSYFIGETDDMELEKRTNRDQSIINEENKLRDIFMIDLYRDIAKNEEVLSDIANLIIYSFDRYSRLN